MAYGTVNADQIQSSVPNVSLGAGNSSLMKNRIINGAMIIDQRNAGASVTPTAGQYLVDRWFYYGTQASKFTAQQNQGSVTPPAGYVNYQGVTVASAVTVGAGDTFFISQCVEGYNIADWNWGTANAKTVTVSFWAYSSLTGTFSGSIRNSVNNYSYPFTYSIPVANTWTQISITIAGPTGGTWNVTNTQGLNLAFNLGSGSSFSGTAGSWSANQYLGATGANSIVATSGATFYITGVQLEVGSSATGFEYRQYQQELALCQRYFYMVSTGTGLPIMMGCYYSTTQIRGMLSFPVTMRSTPSLYSSSGTDYYLFESTLGDNFNSFTIYRPNINNSVLYNSTESSGTTGIAATVVTANASAYVGFSAEL